MRLFLVFLHLLFFSLSAAYMDKIYISLRQCLCLQPQWLYLDVKAHISSTGNSPLNLTLQWFDGGWGGACLLGPGLRSTTYAPPLLGCSANALSRRPEGRPRRDLGLEAGKRKLRRRARTSRLEQNHEVRAASRRSFPSQRLHSDLVDIYTRA
jgi:hypothetical protein